MEHFADRLLAAVEAKGSPVCVGIDPVYGRLPAAVTDQRHFNDPEDDEAAADALFEFSRLVLRVVAPHVPLVKFQSACFERYHAPGVQSLTGLIEEARELGLMVILDAKRGDIGSSSEHYAAGCLADHEDAPGPDALTVNSYLGADGIEPFIQTAAAQGKGLFALVRTSNPGGDALQSLALADGRTVAEAVAGIMAKAGAGHVGERGYSLLGAVVGATKPVDAAKLRQLMPQQIFLVPGYGAQGGTADDVRACFREDGAGAIVTASRSITYAFGDPTAADWEAQVASAAEQLAGEVAAIVRK
jgi:orotidine-5'-phosphate decarboxylase